MTWAGRGRPGGTTLTVREHPANVGPESCAGHEQAAA
jgi:hypothetical protein